jgi:hypothetical protein
MTPIRLALATLALACLTGVAQAQTGCTATDPAGHFEGTAISSQQGKLDVSLSLRCVNGAYAGELTSTAGDFTVKGGHFEAGHLHLDLASDEVEVAVEVTVDAKGLHGTFATADDNGPVELHPVADSKAPATEN